jgi:hypothetical protein
LGELPAQRRQVIKKLVSIVVIGCAVAYMAVLSIVVPAPAARHDDAKAGRKLAYEQSIEAGKERLAPPSDAVIEQSWKADVEPVEPATDAAADETANLDAAESAESNGGDANSDEAAPADEEIALPTEQEAEEADPAAAPDTTGSLAEQPQDGTVVEQPQEGSVAEQPQDGTVAEQPQEEWVEVAISGASMYASTEEDAAVLFAFPYGRKLQVVSRTEGWVQVTDPQSKATGWMKAAYVAPLRQTQQAQGYPDQAYPGYRSRPGWLRRQRDGMAGMINRALGGW